MCGILAIVDFRDRQLSRDLVTRMRDSMTHRGPDDAGLYLDGPVALAHRRLSVIDLSAAGHQPMTNEDGSLQLVFNGEIYNYLELRQELLARGHRFHSSTDSEVILHQYEEDGDACLQKFRGMFAFALWDRKRQRLFAARDRFGIKPLYYYRDQHRVILASEMKAIIADRDVPRRPNMAAVADHLFAGRALGSKTMFSDISELEPACQLSVDRRRRTVEANRYWELQYNYNHSRTAERTLDALHDIVDDAVSVHCRSDAPLGCHLSGGIDSSSVVAFASRHREHLKTFSIKFSDEPHIDETRYAKAVARQVGAQYLEASPGPREMAELLPALVWHMDAPLVSEGGFGYFTVSAFARQHVKVSLTGHGGDEIFAGYPAQFQAAFNRTDMFQLYSDPERIAHRPGLLRRGLRKGPRAIINALLHRASRPGSLEDVWVGLHCGPVPTRNADLDPAFVAGLSGYSPRTEYTEAFARANTDQILDKCLHHDMTVYLPSLLHLEDRLSMAVSLESRVPLLDHHIVEFLATVPPHEKVRGEQPKYLLRTLSSRLVPDEIWQNREKRGFPVPGSFWRTPELGELVRRVLLSRECLDRGIFARDSLVAAASSADITVLWPLVNVELWFKIFVDEDPEWVQKATGAAVALQQL